MTTFNNINTEALAQDQHFHVPAVGGIDSMNPKNAVQPGTLMDCLNYEVTLEAGYTPTEGLLEYRGGSFDAPSRFYSAEFSEQSEGRSLSITSADQVDSVTVTDFFGETFSSLTWDAGLGDNGGVSGSAPASGNDEDELVIKLTFDSSHADWFSVVGDTYTGFSATIELVYSDSDGKTIKSVQGAVVFDPLLSFSASAGDVVAALSFTGTTGAQTHTLPFSVTGRTATDSSRIHIGLATYDFINSTTPSASDAINLSTLTVKVYDMVVGAASPAATVTDLIPGITYKLWKNTNTEIGKIRFLGTDVLPGGFESPTEIKFDLVSGDNEEFTSFLSTASADTYSLEFDSSSITIDDSTIHEDNSTHTNYLDSYTKMVTNLAASGTAVPGTGPITGLFFHEDQLYAARDEAGGTYSELYTVSNTEEQLTDPAWTKVDLGSEFKFKDGQGSPVTVYDKEFLEETVDLSDPIEDRLGSFAKSVRTLNNSYNYTGRWEPDSIDNVLSDDEGDARGAISRVNSTISASVDQPLKDYTHRLEITGFNVGDSIPSSNVSPVGIEVDVRFAFDTLGAIIAGTEKATISQISLLGLGGTDDKASSVPEYDDTDTGTFRTVTLGGAADTWSATNLSSNNLFSDDFGVSLEFQGAVSKPSGSTPPTIQYIVPWVKVTVYFENGDSKIYFWDGSADNGNADLVNISLTDGTFNRKNAAGYMTVYDGTTLANVEVGDEIRTAAAGAGNLIGVVDSVVSTNTLPSSTEMEEASSIMTTKELNFFIDPDKEAVYGTTGASPAFQYNGKHFWFIHTPIPVDLDKPRYLAQHQNTLALSFDSGSALLSPAGQPNTFSGVLGAVEFGFSDKITGLINLGGNALGVLSQTSINAILGTSIQNFTTQAISRSSGALDYTVADIGQPTYLDFRGISNIQATQTYGDFAWGRLSQLISKDIQGKIQKTDNPAVVSSTPVLAIPSKNKNQYRIYFADGTITTMTLFGAAGDVPMFTKQNYTTGNSLTDLYFVPTAYATRVTDKGKEIIVIGTSSGNIFVVDEGNPGIAMSTEIVPFDRSVTFNPFFAGAPYLNVKYSEVMMHLRSTGFTDLNVSAGVNFLKPDSNEPIEATDVGTVSDPVDWELPFDRVSGYLSNITDGFVVKIEGVSDGNPTHVLQALTYKGVGLSDKNASPKRY